MKKRGSMLVFIAIIVLVIALFVFLMMPKIAKTIASGKYALKVATARDIALILDTIYAYPYDIRLDYDTDLSGLEVKIFDKLVTVQENDLDPTLAKYPFVPIINDNPDFLLRSPRKIYFYKTDSRVRVSAIEEEPQSACNKLAFGLRISDDRLKQFAPTSAVAIAWEGIQLTEGGVYDFSRYDTEINNLVDSHIKPRVAFCDGDCFPRWTKTNVVEGYCCVGDSRRAAVCGKVKDDAATKQAFTNVVTAMVDRYKDKVEYWGFGIEPNCRGETPATYTIWLKLFTDAVRSVKPDAVIIGGHLSGTDSNYLSGMYDNGAKDYFNVIALDPYGEPLDREGMQRVRDLMISKGDSSKKIWVTEWGISSGAVGEDRQVALIEEGLRYLSTTPWIGAAYYHNFECELYVSTCAPGTEGYLGFDILRGDAARTPKPSFNAFKQLAENCRPQPPITGHGCNSALTAQVLDTVFQGKNSHLEGLGSCIITAQQTTGVPAILMASIPVTEGGWAGTTMQKGTCPSTGAPSNNLYSIKGSGCPWSVWECYDNNPGGCTAPPNRCGSSKFECQQQANFKVYDTKCDSVDDFVNLITTSPIYANAMNYINDPAQMATELNTAGYATDPNWADKVITVMDEICSEVTVPPSGGCSNVVNIARNYLTSNSGYYYAWGGQSPPGFDCSGFVWYVYNEAGIAPIKDSRLSVTGYWNLLNGDANAKMDPSEWRAGDLCFYNPGAGGEDEHMGIYSGEGTLIHAVNEERDIVEDDNVPIRGTNFVGCVHVCS